MYMSNAGDSDSNQMTGAIMSTHRILPLQHLRCGVLVDRL